MNVLPQFRAKENLSNWQQSDTWDFCCCFSTETGSGYYFNVYLDKQLNEQNWNIYVLYRDKNIFVILFISSTIHSIKNKDACPLSSFLSLCKNKNMN